MMARIEQSIEVNVPVHAAYDQLTQFEQYPRFMEDVAEVQQIDDTHLRCHTRAGHLELEWDAEITQQVPDRAIAWRHLHEPFYEGRVELQPLAADKTRVTLSIECEHDQQILAAYGTAENAMAQRTEHDLVRFKMFVENSWRHGAPEHMQDGASARQSTFKLGGMQGAMLRTAPPGPAAALQPLDISGASMYPASLATAWRMWQDPFGLMRKMSQDFDQLLGLMLARTAPARMLSISGSAMHPWTPAVEVSQRKERLTICAELPGVKREEVQVSVMPGRITIDGERLPQRHQEAQQYRRSECSYGPFHRVVALPEGADFNQAAAQLRDGVLEITMPVVPQGKAGRRIEVQQDP